MQINPLISGWSCCITLGGCGSMSGRKIVRGFKKLGAGYRIEGESVSDEMGESC